MAGFNMAAVSKELDAVQPAEQGITFEDKQLTWDTAEHVKDVVDALNNQKVVHYLKLDGNTLGIEAAKAIGQALEKHPEFRKALWKNMFTRRLKTEIPVALKQLGAGMIIANAQLTVLDLSDNALGPNGMVGLEELLRSRVCYSLQELYLNNCGLGIGGGGMLSAALLDCHRTSTAAGTPLKLKVFVTGRNRLENEGAKSIAKIFATLKTLEVIAMPQNSIYHVGIAALAEGFKYNENLRVLNLNDNTVMEKGAMALADVFDMTNNLREINFGDCLLKTNGAYLFSSALENNHEMLESVDLGFNDINADGGLALMTAFAKKKHLKMLNLDGNCFGSENRDCILKEWLETALVPGALQGLDEDNSEDEADNGGDEGEEVDSVDGEDGGEYDQYETTEEVEEYDEDDYPEETAYLTARLSTKLLNESDSTNKSVTFSEDSRPKEVTAENFCLSQQPCTLQMFEALPDKNKLQALKQTIDQFTEDNHLLLLVFTALKCAHLSKTSTEALEIAMMLYKESFDYAVKTKQERRVVDYYLKQLGLLHTEEKFVSAYDLMSCRYALKEFLNKQEVANENIKNTLSIFLEKSEA